MVAVVYVGAHELPGLGFLATFPVPGMVPVLEAFDPARECVITFITRVIFLAVLAH